MDSKVFFLCATAGGAALGYVIGRSIDKNGNLVSRVQRAVAMPLSWEATCTLAGAMVGASVGFTVWYVETVISIFSSVAQAAMRHPKTSLGIAAVTIAVVALASQDDDSKGPKRP